MKKTSNFFIIDNFNTVPDELLSYTDEYIIYDASTDESVEQQLKSRGLHYKKVPRTCHNISSYFLFFYENYEKLPDVMVCTKGHMIGRHCSKNFFDRVYDNKFFTGLFDSSGLKGMTAIPLCAENFFVEKRNAGTFIFDRPQKYFMDADDLYGFIFEADKFAGGGYYVFAPGGEYIVTKDQILQYKKIFWKNLYKIVSYGMTENNCPSEAHFIERLLPLIFCNTKKVRDYMYDENEFDKLLAEKAADFEMKKISFQKKHSGYFGKIKKVLRIN